MIWKWRSFAKSKRESEENDTKIHKENTIYWLRDVIIGNKAIIIFKIVHRSFLIEFRCVFVQFNECISLSLKSKRVILSFAKSLSSLKTLPIVQLDKWRANSGMNRMFAIQFNDSNRIKS